MLYSPLRCYDQYLRPHSTLQQVPIQAAVSPASEDLEVRRMLANGFTCLYRSESDTMNNGQFLARQCRRTWPHADASPLIYHFAPFNQSFTLFTNAKHH